MALNKKLLHAGILTLCPFLGTCAPSIYERFYVRQISMFPTLHPGDILITEHLTEQSPKINLEDIVIFKDPTGEQGYFVKRVVALPGEFYFSEEGKKIIPNNFYFVMGDNTEYSTDSRVFGLIKPDYIVKKLDYANPNCDHPKFKFKLREEDFESKLFSILPR